MEGYTYYVVTETVDGKFCSYATAVHRTENLVHRFCELPLYSVNNVKTLKEAKAIAAAWNEDWKRNGTYALISNGVIYN